MRTVVRRTIEFIRSEEGATATEYAIAVTLIALALVASAGVFRDALSGRFIELGEEVSDLGA